MFDQSQAIRKMALDQAVEAGRIVLNTESELNRKKFLKTSAAVGAGLGMVYLAACKKKAADEEMETAAPASSGGACSDVSGLSAEDQQLRNNMVNSLQYVEKTPMADKDCENCQFFTGSAPCGGCTLIKGPIAAKGYCTSWAAKA